MTCRQCGNTTLERVTRRTLLQKVAAPLFGYYPWRCVRCQAVVLLHVRKTEKDTESV